MGIVAEKKEKRYVSDNAHLMAEWNWEKNNELRIDPQLLTVGSTRKVWWKCNYGHAWQSRIDQINKGHSCPYCSGRFAIKGENDLQTVNPTLADEWNYEKNDVITPSEVMPNSGKKVWWKCSYGHEWKAAIYSRNNGHGCPYCSGKYIIKGENDLQTINPILANEWNYDKNDDLTPSDVLPNSNRKVWWKCSFGHEWKVSINHRSKGSGCPYCSGRYADKGKNDLQTVNPSLSEEWNYEKNNGLTPSDILPGSGKKVWWKCRKNHIWQATVKSRSIGAECPICNSERHTSFPEYALVYYLKTYGFEVVHSYRRNGYELDVYIPSKKIAIEYDGFFWHKDKKAKDLEKNQKCEKDGIKLYRIREGLPPLSSTSLDYVIQSNQKDLEKIFTEILSEITETSIDIDLQRDSNAIEKLREHTEKEDSILSSSPEIAKEWNYEKNGDLKPEHYTVGCTKKVWWKCSNGHEWQATINHRHNGRRCPYCSSRKILVGFNDLQTVNPNLSKEWDYELNNELTPCDVLPNSNKKVWWVCCYGHKWKAAIAHRNNGTGCPYCTSRKVLQGFNDLQTVNPALSKEWHYEKNNGLIPTDISQSSGKKVWWQCSCGHEWQSTIANRSKGRKCPQCARKKLKK